MRIAHCCPFAPNRAGIYEAARDMARADAEAGHGVDFVDTGVTVAGNATKEPPQVGAVDDRGGFRIVTASPSVLDVADVLVFHSGVPDAWVVRSQAPIVWILHGRPLAAFRLERAHPDLQPYSLLKHVAEWPRTKALVSFWPEHAPYWAALFGAEKLRVLGWPPIDLERFSPDGPRHVFEPRHRGEINGLIADASREDLDAFDVAHGALEAARRIPGLRWHFYALDTPLGPWEHVIDALRRIGALGELCGRMADMEQVYRAADLLLTPQRIATRTIGEAQACGTPVLAAMGCRATGWTVDIGDPLDIGLSVENLVKALAVDTASIRRNVRVMAERRHSQARYVDAMGRIYSEAMGLSVRGGARLEVVSRASAEEQQWQAQ